MDNDNKAGPVTEFNPRLLGDGVRTSKRSASTGEQTLRILTRGAYKVWATEYDIKNDINESKQGTRIYAFDHRELENADSQPPRLYQTDISVENASTMETIHLVRRKREGRIGVLNFASPIMPGGGFVQGVESQEASLARSSTLYTSLSLPSVNEFYRHHIHHPDSGYFSDTLIYTPGVVVFRDERTNLQKPTKVDVVTSCPVNANDVRSNMLSSTPYVRREEVESEIKRVMLDRMGKILMLLERKRVPHLVLGAFGAGVFQNRVYTIARNWKLLLGPGKRFEHSFKSVCFAVLGYSTMMTFQDAFGLSPWSNLWKPFSSGLGRRPGRSDSGNRIEDSKGKPDEGQGSDLVDKSRSHGKNHDASGTTSPKTTDGSSVSASVAATDSRPASPVTIVGKEPKSTRPGSPAMSEVKQGKSKADGTRHPGRSPSMLSRIETANTNGNDLIDLGAEISSPFPTESMAVDDEDRDQDPNESFHDPIDVDEDEDDDDFGPFKEPTNLNSWHTFADDEEEEITSPPPTKPRDNKNGNNPGGQTPASSPNSSRKGSGDPNGRTEVDEMMDFTSHV